MLNIKKFCKKNSIKVIENYDFGIKHGFKVPGFVSYFIETKNEKKLCDLLYFAKNNKIKILGISSGTNLLISKARDLVLVKFSKKDISINKVKNDESIKIVKASSGVLKKDLMNFCIDNSCSGLEFWSGIPGAVSGGVAMNAGAYDEDMSNKVLDIEFASPNGIKKLCTGELKWSYRNLEIPDYYIICSVSFLTKDGNKVQISKKCNNFLKDRELKHPLYFSSCGSTFKNPNGKKAWDLIKGAGLCGLEYNGVKVSLLHSNFIVSNGKETLESKDIINLINKIKELVFNKYKIKLEEEIRIIEE